MNATIITTWVGGGFGIGGVLLGHILGGRAESKKSRQVDAERWQADRRKIYAEFMALTLQMARKADSVACFLPYRPEDSAADGDLELRKEIVREIWDVWDERFQETLLEVELLGSPNVATVANEYSEALLDLVGIAEAGSSYLDAKDPLERFWALHARFRNLLRRELGLSPTFYVRLGTPDTSTIGLRRHPGDEPDATE
ncbi:hypothetical protein [Frankia sp. Cr2]|uniref:hypothetical protein n=1 Tax=Frankia sp. Cr2 TaxID=3073932 RepID=UPI002AD49B48|nr:hypothetical protein [Frankia sp. Cr2]